MVRGHLDLLKLLLTAAHGRNCRQKAPRAAAAHRSVALLVHTAGRHRWRGVAPLRGGSAGGAAMAWRGTLRRRKGFGGVEMATYQRAASSSRGIFSRKNFPVGLGPFDHHRSCINIQVSLLVPIPLSFDKLQAIQIMNDYLNYLYATLLR